VSDQVGGLRTSTSSAFALLALPFLYLTQHLPVTARTGLPPLAAAYFLLGLFVNGPKTLSGIALRQLVPPSMAGTAMGVQGLVGQVGASWAGAPVGFVAQHWGWGAIKHLWAASLLAAAGCLSVPGLLVKARRVAAQQREKSLGLDEGPLLKLFNYYLPPSPEERAALDAKRKAQQAQRAAEAAQAARAERRRRRAEQRSAAASTLGGLLRRRPGRGQRNGRVDEDEGEGEGEGEEQGLLQEEPESEVGGEHLGSEDAPEPPSSSSSSSSSSLRRRWLSRRANKQGEQTEGEVEHQQQQDETQQQQQQQLQREREQAEEDEEGLDESALTLRQRITRRARRMRRRLREAVTVTTTDSTEL
jgi:hypothetical protein